MPRVDSWETAEEALREKLERTHGSVDFIASIGGFGNYVFVVETWSIFVYAVGPRGGCYAMLGPLTSEKAKDLGYGLANAGHRRSERVEAAS